MTIAGITAAVQNHNHRDFILEHTVHHGIGYWRTKKVYQYSAIALGPVIGLDTPLRLITGIRNAELNLVAIDTAPLVNQGDVISLALAVRSEEHTSELHSRAPL